MLIELMTEFSQIIETSEVAIKKEPDINAIIHQEGLVPQVQDGCR